MGSDFCTCLNDVTSPESENLARGKDSRKKIDNNPKIVFNNNSTIESVDPSYSREKDSKCTTISSNKKNSILSLRNSNYYQKEKKKIKNLKNNLNNKKNNNNNKYSNNKSNNNKKINNKNNNKTNNEENNDIEKSSSVKKLNKEEFVNVSFKNFFNTPKGQEMTLNINEYPNKLCVTLHKYLLSLIAKREFKKNIKCYVEEGNQLYQECIDKIYELNVNLKKAELNSAIKYTPDGYLKYYTDEKDIKNMKFEEPKESFDNCTIINYSDYKETSIENMLWVYKGQANKSGMPHGFGEKFYKNGIKQKGFWKDGAMYGWGEEIDKYGNISIGPFYNNDGITGKGEKYILKKKILYKGDFIKGEKSGKGEENSNEGNFVGNFYKNKKNGKGKMIYKLSGDIYEGDYKDDLFDGNGHYIWKATGQEYKGEYKNGLMNGKGLFEWSEGEFYRGNFVNGKMEGDGELHMGNGRIFIGPFTNGRPNGIGIFDNGIDFKGEMEFNDGRMNIDYMKKKYSATSSYETLNIDNFNEVNTDNKKEEEYK